MMIARVNSLTYDRLGSSYFQGLVYTNGFVYSANDVHVVGALIANDDGSQTGEVLAGVQLEPGDIFLTKGASLTYNQEYFSSPEGGSAGASGALAVTAWIGR